MPYRRLNMRPNDDRSVKPLCQAISPTAMADTGSGANVAPRPLQPRFPHHLRDALVIAGEQPVQGRPRAADGERDSIRRQVGVDTGTLNHCQRRSIEALAQLVWIGGA